MGDPDFGCQTGARPCGNFPRGPRTITWTAADEYGDVTTTTSVVTVDDRTPRVISPVSPITVVACNAAGETVVVPVPTAVDRCIGSVQVTGVVIASTTASVPRNVVNGQVSLPAGVHTIRWTATDGITSSQVTQVVTVRPGIFANRDLELRDRARTNAGERDAGLGEQPRQRSHPDRQRRDVGQHSQRRARRHEGPRARGRRDHHFGHTDARQSDDGDRRDSDQHARQPAAVPQPRGRLVPPAGGQDLFINGTVTLAPGSYRSVTVNSNGTLVLWTGDYFFTGLFTVNSSSTVRINDTAGPVRIFVSTAFAYRAGSARERIARRRVRRLPRHAERR